MMHDKRIRTLGTLSIGAVLGAIAACAGSDTPATDPDTLQQIAEMYAGASSVGVAGAAGTPATGTGGSASGSGGSQSSTNGGSSSGSDSGNGGSSVSEAGSAGSAGTASEGGSAGSDMGGAGGGGDCDGFAVLQTNCGSSSCHGQGGPFNGFLASEDVAAGFDGQNGMVSCGSAGPLFDSGNPEASIVVQKMQGTATCGGPMPPPSGGVSDEDIACVVEWISSL